MKKFLLLGFLLIFFSGLNGQDRTKNFNFEEKEQKAPLYGKRRIRQQKMRTGKREHDPFMRIMKALSEANLTNSQLTNVRKMETLTKQKMSEWMANLKNLRENLKDESFKAKMNQKKINQIAGKMGSIHQEMALNFANNVRQIRTILKPIQWQKFEEAMLLNPPTQ